MNDKRRRGFAGMDEAKQREIASRGGKAAHQKGTAHRFTTEEARTAGRKGGQVAHIRGTAHEFTPDEARAAGRKGGKAVRERHSTAERVAEPRPQDTQSRMRESPTEVPAGTVSPGQVEHAGSAFGDQEHLSPSSHETE